MQLILKREFKKTLSFDQTLVRLLSVHFRFSIGFCPGSFSPILARIWLGHFVENLPPLMIGPNSSFSAHDVLSITLAFLQQRSCQVVLALVIASLFWCFLLVILHLLTPTLFLGYKCPPVLVFRVEFNLSPFLQNPILVALLEWSQPDCL